MTRTAILSALAGAALLLGPLAAAQAQTRVAPPKTQLPSMGGLGSSFAAKNGGAFANQGGIAAQARPGGGSNLIGMDHATKPGIMSRDSAGILSHNGGLMRGR